MTTDSNYPFDELRNFFNKLIFERNFSFGIGNGNVGMLSRFKIQKRLSKRKKPEDISNIYLLINIAEEKNVVNLSSEDRKLLQQIKSIKPLMEDFLAKLPIATQTTLDKPEPVLSHKISEVLDIMLLKGNNCMPEQKNKKNVLSKLLDKIGLTLEDDYSKFHNIETINEISRYVVNLDAKGTDFIFSKCRTKNGKYNNKYTVREIFKYLLDIGVKKKSKDSYNFHSFRKNASIAMQDAGISQSYINDIIGWEGKTTMEQSYSNHSLPEIKAAMEKFRYDFLSSHFAKWKKIMKKAK